MPLLIFSWRYYLWLLLALTFVFSTASNAERVASNAEALHETNAAVGSAALTRAAVAQAVVFGIDYTIHGVATNGQLSVVSGTPSPSLSGSGPF